MITGAIIGASIVGGVALAFVAVTFGAATFAEDRTPLWPMGVLAIVGVALAGAGFGAMIGSWSVHLAPSKPTQETTCSGAVSPSNSHESR